MKEIKTLQELDSKSGETLAYLAGILDGEGYIAVVNHGDCPRLIVRISMFCPKSIDFIFGEFGGSRYFQPTGNRIDHRIAWYGPYAKIVLEKVLPFLHVKADLAQLGIEFEKLRQVDPIKRGRGGKHSNSYVVASADFVLQSKELIRKQYEAINV